MHLVFLTDKVKHFYKNNNKCSILCNLQRKILLFNTTACFSNLVAVLLITFSWKFSKFFTFFQNFNCFSNEKSPIKGMQYCLISVHLYTIINNITQNIVLLLIMFFYNSDKKKLQMVLLGASSKAWAPISQLLDKVY